jgi:hypothetical protein
LIVMVKTFVFLLSVVLAAPALAQAGPPPPPPDDAQPAAPPPQSQPPPPPAAAPPTSQPIEPPQATGNTSAVPSSVPGEWVYTTQYGWVWMPYDQQYTHVVETSGVAYTFVFYPGFGWRWVLSPWVFGLGPRPYFAHGPGRFAWYARPWFRAHPLVRRKVVRTHRR